MNPHRRIELVYFSGCPNVDDARKHLRQALTAIGLSLEWSEWDCAEDRCPARYRGFGSPTILVDGRDVAVSDGPEATEQSCRLYRDDTDRLCGAPSVASIIHALRQATLSVAITDA